MERYLMDCCDNYKSESCHPEIIAARRNAEIINGKIPLWPSGKEQEKLDEICAKCDSRYFRISKYECPACHNQEFQKILNGGEILDERGQLKAKIFFMECEKCKSKLKLVAQY
jgi:Zn finger protein HypA/HybF involved in hydrogenase expression